MQSSAGSLRQQLETFFSGVVARVPAADKQALLDVNRAMRDSARPLFPVGAQAPDFTLPDQHGKPVRLSEQLRHGPAVVLFLRGGWCPFSAISLRAYQAALPKIEALGASVMAVLPEPCNRCSVTAERDLLAFPTLSDSDNRVAADYGVLFDIPPSARPFYIRLGHDLPRQNRTGAWRVPLPATFVIGTDGRVALAHLEPALYGRLEPTAAVAALQNLRVDA